MCLLLAALDVVVGHPLVCLANRDEYWERESEPPAARGGEPEIVCGLDRRAGGTWLGMNGAGVVAVLTNRRGTYDPTRPSRGSVCLAALAGRSAADGAGRALAAAAPGPNPFSLFVADAKGARFVGYDGPSSPARVRDLGPGLHTLTNLEDLDQVAPADVLRAAEGGAIELPRGIGLDEAIARLQRLAQSHAPLASARERTCVHDLAHRRGTVSSAILAIDARGRPARFFYANGAPCTAGFGAVQVPTAPA